MAIFSTGGGVLGIRGTIGGLTFSANSSGPCIKPKPQPSRKFSYSATLRRVFLAGLPIRWRNLSALQRSNWATFAMLPEEERFNSLGQSYFLTGYQSFCGHNLRLLNASMSDVSDAPVDPLPLPPASYGCTYQSSGGSFDAILTFPAGTFSTYAAWVDASVANSLGRDAAPPRKFLVRTEYPVDPMATSLDFTISYALNFGLPAAGYRLFLSVRCLTFEGRISTPLEQSFDYIP